MTQYVLDGWDPAKGSPTGLENYDVLADLDGGGSLTTRYLHGDGVDQLFARVDAGGGGLWYSTDHQGSVWGLVDNAGGDQVMSVQYDTFGHISLQTGSVELGRYTWTGRELDSVTGLQYNRARWYDPQIGRWISQDPMGFAAGDSNLYRYVNNKPVVATDPSGLWQIQRNNAKNRATAKAEQGDTIQSLAKAIGLLPDEYKNWLTLPVGKIAIAGNKGVTLDDLKVTDVITTGQEVEIPNSIKMIWIGALEGLGMRAVSWSEDAMYYRNLGFSVGLVDYSPKNVTPDSYRSVLLRSLRQGTTEKTLQGIEVAGHGGFIGIQSQDRKVTVLYKEMMAKMKYRLGVVVLNVCMGNWSKDDKGFKGEAGDFGGRDLSSGFGDAVFMGTNKTLVPPWGFGPYKGTFHPWWALTEGKQGTNPNADVP